MVIDLIVTGRDGFGSGFEVGAAVGAVAAAGVAAITAFEVVGGGEDEVRAIHVEVFGREFLRGGLGLAGFGGRC
jgi:hypothetical protein